MTTTVYRGIDDPIYSVTSQPVPVDKDTSSRAADFISAAANGTGGTTAATCLNRGVKTTFTFAQDPGTRLRWGGLALRLQMRFGTTNLAGACPTTVGAGWFMNSPPPFLVGSLIRGITLQINGNQVWTADAGNYYHDFVARLLRYYDYETLQQAGQMLFTPFGGTRYDARAGGATAVTDDLILPVTGATNAIDPKTVARGMQYCAGPASNTRVITKIIPFTDLFPRLPDACLKNLRTIKIDIDWENNQDLLDHRSTLAADQAFVYLTEADILVDKYIMGMSQTASALSEKVSGELDYIPYLSTRVHAYDYNGADYIIPGVKSLDTVLIFQPARGISNGVAANDECSFASASQFVMFGNVAGTTIKDVKHRMDDPAALPVGSVAGLTSAQIVYSGQAYPQSPVQITNGAGSFDASGLYYEYLKAVNKHGSRSMQAAVPYDVFRTTMPFICFRPFASDAPKPSTEGRDLTIRLRGGPAARIFVVLFSLHVHTIDKNLMGFDYQ